MLGDGDILAARRGTAVRRCGMAKVILEPSLERTAGGWTPAQRRKMAALYEQRARVLWRWARQLWVSAAILDERARLRRPRRLPHLPTPVLRKN